MSLLAQGKFFGGIGMGYHCVDVRDTIACAATSGLLNQVGCDSISVNGQTFATSGTYLQTLVNADGCDSLLTLVVTINSVDATVSVTATSITANGTGSYQWLDCDNGLALISGEIGQSYIPNNSGNYAVEVTRNGCTDTSACTNIIVSGLRHSVQMGMSIFPNPSAEAFRVSFDEVQVHTTLTVLDVLGQAVVSDTLAQATELSLAWEGSAGIYFLQVIDAAGHRNCYRLVKR